MDVEEINARRIKIMERIAEVEERIAEGERRIANHNAMLIILFRHKNELLQEEIELDSLLSDCWKKT